ncbi:Uncharacterized protein L484_001687 [Morus notabilis]|uniref:GYF domain-containing protein n=1 Tax=Morus notabilis TaxID=981085 RepID=W9R544_9ROSA|nr:Uncharacterized protein L484_001687 [Morus notabilis]
MRVVCDERLRALFGKKSFSRAMIYKLLEPHLAADNGQGDYEDGYFSWGNEEVEGVEAKGQQEKHKRLVVETCNANPTTKSFFAAVIPENIKLIYLKRSIIQNILKQDVDPKTIEIKIVGSFVRTKSDPNDYRQKHSHNLLVAGLKVSSGTGGSNNSVIKDVPTCMLSDEDFSKEECEDLRQRVKDGMLERPKVEELQHKARILHEDITKHYLERKELFEKSDQQSRLLREVPQIIAEEIEVEATPECRQEEIKQRKDDSPGPIIGKPVEAPISDTSDDEFELTWTLDIEESGRGGSVQESQQQLTKSINENRGESEAQKENVRESMPLQGVMELQVIDLRDDDEESEPPSQKEQTSGDKLESLTWHYLDPQGEIQGPFAITLLKRWSDATTFLQIFRFGKQVRAPLKLCI